LKASQGSVEINQNMAEQVWDLTPQKIIELL
jgi:hypothetical protein